MDLSPAAYECCGGERHGSNDYRNLVVADGGGHPRSCRHGGFFYLWRIGRKLPGLPYVRSRAGGHDSLSGAFSDRGADCRAESPIPSGASLAGSSLALGGNFAGAFRCRASWNTGIERYAGVPYVLFHRLLCNGLWARRAGGGIFSVRDPRDLFCSGIYDFDDPELFRCLHVGRRLRSSGVSFPSGAAISLRGVCRGDMSQSPDRMLSGSGSDFRCRKRAFEIERIFEGRG